MFSQVFSIALAFYLASSSFWSRGYFRLGKAKQRLKTILCTQKPPQVGGFFLFIITFTKGVTFFMGLMPEIDPDLTNLQILPKP